MKQSKILNYVFPVLIEKEQQDMKLLVNKRILGLVQTYKFINVS